MKLESQGGYLGHGDLHPSEKLLVELGARAAASQTVHLLLHSVPQQDSAGLLLNGLNALATLVTQTYELHLKIRHIGGIYRVIEEQTVDILLVLLVEVFEPCEVDLRQHYQVGLVGEQRLDVVE